MKREIGYIILILCGIILSCKAKVTQEDLIQSALALKLDQWKEEQINECKSKAMKEAEAYVDSMLIIYSLPSKLDTIPKPSKPVKPPKPVFKVKPDSVVIGN